MRVCCCVCVCARAHTHTHTHACCVNCLKLTCTARGLQELLLLASNVHSSESKRRVGYAWCLSFGAQGASCTASTVKKTFGHHLRHILHSLAKMGLCLCYTFTRLHTSVLWVVLTHKRIQTQLLLYLCSQTPWK